MTEQQDVKPAEKPNVKVAEKPATAPIPPIAEQAAKMAKTEKQAAEVNAQQLEQAEKKVAVEKPKDRKGALTGKILLDIYEKEVILKFEGKISPRQLQLVRLRLGQQYGIYLKSQSKRRVK